MNTKQANTQQIATLLPFDLWANRLFTDTFPQIKKCVIESDGKGGIKISQIELHEDKEIK